MAPISSLLSDAEAYAEAKITAALTPAVLSRLAFKGITPQQAREFLRARVALEVAREFSL